MLGDNPLVAGLRRNGPIAAKWFVWSFGLDWDGRCIAALKDILNATFTLLHEYEIGRSAVLAAQGRPDDAVEDFDAFIQPRQPIRGHR